MTEKAVCPGCDTTITVHIWLDDKCPHCEEEYYWESFYVYDPDDVPEDDQPILRWEMDNEGSFNIFE